MVERIRKNRKAGMEIGEAVDKAIDDMPVDYSIRMFLIGNRAEVKDMCITEYNEAETMKMFREEGREEGQEQGEDRLGQLVSVLISKGRSEDVQRAATNKEARKRLYEEFNMN